MCKQVKPYRAVEKVATTVTPAKAMVQVHLFPILWGIPTKDLLLTEVPYQKLVHIWDCLLVIPAQATKFAAICARVLITLVIAVSLLKSPVPLL